MDRRDPATETQSPSGRQLPLASLAGPIAGGATDAAQTPREPLAPSRRVPAESFALLAVDNPKVEDGVVVTSGHVGAFRSGAKAEPDKGATIIDPASWPPTTSGWQPTQRSRTSTTTRSTARSTIAGEVPIAEHPGVHWGMTSESKLAVYQQPILAVFWTGDDQKPLDMFNQALRAVHRIRRGDDGVTDRPATFLARWADRAAGPPSTPLPRWPGRTGRCSWCAWRGRRAPRSPQPKLQP